MSDYYTFDETVTRAKNIKNGVEKQYKLVENIQWAYFIAKQILEPKKNVNKWYIKPPSKPSGDNLSRQVLKKDYIDMAKRFVAYCDKNKEMPNYISLGSYKMKPNDYIYMFSRILVYYADKKAYPNYAEVNSKAYVKPTETGNAVFNYFVDVFGSVSTIDGALGKIAKKGYGYYYDDKYNNRASIDRMKQGKGVNCTDSCQVFFNIAKALGYEVHCLHIKCRGGDGHVRLKLRHKTHTKNEWIYRDPACTLKNGGTCNWCMNGTLLATDPNWFMQNLNR